MILANVELRYGEVGVASNPIYYYAISGDKGISISSTARVLCVLETKPRRTRQCPARVYNAEQQKDETPLLKRRVLLPGVCIVLKGGERIKT